MLCLKLLCGLSLFALVLGAPADENLEVKKRVERNRRQLINDVVDKKLDLENYDPLKVVEVSLEQNDGKGDNEINGTRNEDGKDIQYYHKKNKGTVKTIVEEKKNNKMEDVFYHVSYEKQQDEKEVETTTLLEETTQDTTDQTLDEDDTITPEEVTFKPEQILDVQNNVYDKQPKSENEDMPNDEDITVPSVEKEDKIENNNNNNELDQQQYSNNNNNGWFSNWFNWLSNDQNAAGNVDQQNQNNDQQQSDSQYVQTDNLDNAIESQQFTILSPFYFGSVGLKSPSCPSHRSTLVSIYFFSFCV